MIPKREVKRETTMIIRTIATAAVLVLLSAPAFAFHCPSDMKKIDATLAKDPALNSKVVKELRAAGEDLHKAGKHYAAYAALHKVMEIHGIRH